MGIDEDDHDLFGLLEPERAGPQDRATRYRQVWSGVTLLLLATVAAWLLPGVLSDGPPQSDDTVLMVDGDPHVAPTSAERSSMLWFDESLAAPTCEVHDVASGDVLALAQTDGSQRRSRGSQGDWVGAATFAPTSDAVEVTCTSAPGAVLVSQAPTGPAGLLSIGLIVLVPLTLALAGLVLVVAAATSWVQTRVAARG